MKATKKALAYHQQALSMHQKVGNKEGEAKSYSNMATLRGNDFLNKINDGLKAKKLWDELNPMHPEAIINVGNLGLAYFNMARSSNPSNLLKEEQLHLAKKYLEEAIQRSKEKENADNQAYFSGVLAEVQAFVGDYKNAYLNFRQFYKVQDSIYSQEMKNKIANLEGQREIRLRDKQLQINRLELDTQRKQRAGLLIGLGLLLVIGGCCFGKTKPVNVPIQLSFISIPSLTKRIK
ncbi:MAG: hypothetical protein R2822_21040 [Spirosomataceae bacterium]